MEARYQTLLIIHSIVKSDPSPQTYLCSAHDIILRHSFDWKEISDHLDELEKEGFVTIKKLDKLAVSITTLGITKCRNLQNNFVVNNFTFTNEKNALNPEKAP